MSKAPIHYLLGLRPVTVGPAGVTFAMPASPRLRSDGGVFHAGTSALVADAALAGAVQVTLPAGAVVATSDVSVNFLRPVDVDSGQLIARARPIDVGDSLGLAECTVGDGRGRLIAHAQRIRNLTNCSPSTHSAAQRSQTGPTTASSTTPVRCSATPFCMSLTARCYPHAPDLPPAMTIAALAERQAALIGQRGVHGVADFARAGRHSSPCRW